MCKGGWRSPGTKIGLSLIVRLFFLIWQSSFWFIYVSEGNYSYIFRHSSIIFFFLSIPHQCKHTSWWNELYRSNFFIFIFTNDLSIKNHVPNSFTKHDALWQRTSLKEHKIHHWNQKPKSSLNLKKKKPHTPPKQVPALSSIYEVIKKAGSV